MEIDQASLDQSVGGGTHYDITMGNVIAMDTYCDITMGYDIIRDIHCDVTMSNNANFPCNKFTKWNILNKIYFILLINNRALKGSMMYL